MRIRVSGVDHGLHCRESVAADGAQRQRVVVDKIAQKTPAADAGLRSGDEVVFVADQRVGNRFDVERAFWDHKPGEEVRVTVIRQGKEMKVGLTLATAKFLFVGTAAKVRRAAASTKN